MILSNSNNQVEIFFLLSPNVSTQQVSWQKVKHLIKNKGLIRTLEQRFFKALTTIEYKALSIFLKNIRGHFNKFSLDKFIETKIIHLRPIFSTSNLFIHYSNEDINKIKALNLDIIIRGNISGIFKGDVLNSAKEGVVSFCYGDNRWNYGGPPAFWEVYLKKESTGFTIQILTENMDDRLVIFRGNIPTKRSYTENIINLHNSSNPFLSKIILQYAKSNKLPPVEKTSLTGGAELMVPTLFQSTLYILKTFLLYFFVVFERLVLRKYKRWGVAFIKDPWNKAILRKGIQIKNPPNRFFADPFVIEKNGRTICYVEDYYYKQRKGCITAIELLNKNKYKILGTVIKESFHMSFPFIFEYQKELYMIPETGEANSIRLYKCVDFPLKWKYQKNILNNVNALDSMIFLHKQKWWLLFNVDGASLLYAFYSDNPLSDNWTPHKLNPLIFDSTIARNGGILNINGDSPIRVRQKQTFNFYGKSLTLSKIVNLTPSSFSEKNIGQILPDFFKNINGCHHIHSNEKFTVYDYVKTTSLK